MESKLIKKVEDENVGVCLIAIDDIPAGTIIIREESTLSSKMLLSTIQHSKGLHVNLPIEGYIWRTEHMCDPNAYLLVESELTGTEKEEEKEGAKASVSLIAIKDIEAGDHVGYDYNTTEVILSRSFECRCGRSLCHGNVGGFHYLSSEERSELVERLGVKTMSPAVVKAWEHTKRD